MRYLILCDFNYICMGLDQIDPWLKSEALTVAHTSFNAFIK